MFFLGKERGIKGFYEKKNSKKKNRDFSNVFWQLYNVQYWFIHDV